MFKNNRVVVVVGILIFAAIYFFLRLYHILSLPIFTDEAIYVRWTEIAKQDPNWRFISLVDGKQPSFIWIAAIVMKFVHEPLLATRLVSVGAGFLTTIGLFFLGSEIFKDTKRGNYRIFALNKFAILVGAVSSILYVFYSFALVYDRMALYDSLVGTFAVWSLYVLIVLVRSLRLDVALISGIIIGGGMLTKTNAFFSLYSMPFLLAIFNWSKIGLKKRFITFAVLCLVVAVVSNGIYSVLRLSPFFHIINQKNALFVYPFHEWIQHPFTYLGNNLQGLTDWVWRYFSFPWIILAVIAFFINKKNFWEKALLVVWFAFPLTGLAFFGNTIYPRHIFFMTLSLLPLVAFTFVVLWGKYRSVFLRAILILFTFSFMIYTDYFILFDFAHAPIPRSDTNQYYNNWTAGAGVNQSVAFFRQQASHGKIFIATEGTFGLMPYALEIYLVDNPNIIIRGYWPIDDSPPKEVTEAAKKMPTYAVFYQPCLPCKGYIGAAPTDWHAQLIVQYKQGTSNAYYSLYRINP